MVYFCVDSWLFISEELLYVAPSSYLIGILVVLQYYLDLNINILVLFLYTIKLLVNRDDKSLIHLMEAYSDLTDLYMYIHEIF